MVSFNRVDIGPDGGECVFKFLYSNGSGSGNSRTYFIKVNDILVSDMKFDPTESWSDWKYTEFVTSNSDCVANKDGKTFNKISIELAKEGRGYIYLGGMDFKVTAREEVDHGDQHSNHEEEEAEDTVTEVTMGTLEKVGNNGKPEDVFPLAACHGDCDKDEDCQSGLVCMQREGGEVVPGCNGEDKSSTDYCYNKAMYEHEDGHSHTDDIEDDHSHTIEDHSDHNHSETGEDNLIVNGDFEDGLEKWYMNSGEFKLDETNVYSGSHSVLCTDRKAHWNGIEQVIDVEKVQKDATYRVSCYAKIKEGAAKDKIKLTFRVETYDDDGEKTFYLGPELEDIVQDDINDSDWSYYEGQVALNVTGTITGVQFYAEGPAEGVEYWVDEISAVKVEQVYSVELSCQGLKCIVQGIY